MSHETGMAGSPGLTPVTPGPGPDPRPHARRIRAARIIAIVADVLQLAFFPAFAGGWLSPVNNVLDVVVALIMVRLVGWHFAFLPTFVAEMVPGVDLVPSWTMAVWFATRGGAQSPPSTSR